MSSFPILEEIESFFSLRSYNIPEEELEAAAKVLYEVPFAMYRDGWERLRKECPRWEHASDSQKNMCRAQARYVLLHYVKRIAETKEREQADGEDGERNPQGAQATRDYRRARRNRRRGG